MKNRLKNLLKTALYKTEALAPGLSAPVWGALEDPRFLMEGMWVKQMTDSVIELESLRRAPSLSLCVKVGEYLVKSLMARQMLSSERLLFLDGHCEVFEWDETQRFKARINILENDREKIFREARQTGHGEMEVLIQFFGKEEKLLGKMTNKIRLSNSQQKALVLS
jgi:hypothetical protein